MKTGYIWNEFILFCHLLNYFCICKLGWWQIWGVRMQKLLTAPSREKGDAKCQLFCFSAERFLQ